MFDDPGDIDRNGIPDSIQRDPIVVPEPPIIFGEPADRGLPGITEPFDMTADAGAEPLPELPVAPIPPPEDADEAAMAEYQRELGRYNRMFEMYSKIMADSHEMKKALIQNLPR